MSELSCNMLLGAKSYGVLSHWWQGQRAASREWQLGQNLPGPLLPGWQPPGLTLLDCPFWSSLQASDFLGENNAGPVSTTVNVSKAFYRHSLFSCFQVYYKDTHVTQATTVCHGSSAFVLMFLFPSILFFFFLHYVNLLKSSNKKYTFPDWY